MSRSLLKTNSHSTFVEQNKQHVSKVPLKWTLEKQVFLSVSWKGQSVFSDISLLAEKQSTKHHRRKLRMKCTKKEITRVIDYLLEPIV